MSVAALLLTAPGFGRRARFALASGTGEVGFHDLRSVCASLLIDAGASPKDVQAHLGHASIQTTLEIYARVRPERSSDLAQRLDALIDEGVKARPRRGEAPKRYRIYPEETDGVRVR